MEGEIDHFDYLTKDYEVSKIIRSPIIAFKCINYDGSPYYFLYSKDITKFRKIQYCGDHPSDCQCLDCFVYRMDIFITEGIKPLVYLWFCGITDKPRECIATYDANHIN